jgi:hypothetical protein
LGVLGVLGAIAKMEQELSAVLLDAGVQLIRERCGPACAQLAVAHEEHDTRLGQRFL